MANVRREARNCDLHEKPRFGVYIGMTIRLVRRAGLALVAIGLACSYMAYGLTHPPKDRAFRYQGVNSIQDISLVFTLTNIDNHQEIAPVVPTSKK